MRDSTLNSPDFSEKILYISPIGICVLDSDGQFIFANARAREIVGLQKEELTQRYYYSPEWKMTDLEGRPIEKGQYIFERMRESREPLSGVRLVVQRPDDARIVLSVNAAPLCDETGCFNGMIATYEDITQRMRFEELTDHVEKLEQILESIPIGVQIVDGEGLNVYANRRAQEILGLSFDEITRRYSHSSEWNLTDMDGNPLAAEDRVFARVKESRQALYGQKLMVQRPDEHWIAISVNAQPLFDSSPRFSGLAAVYEDITERVVMERELAQHRDQLEETVRQRTLRLQEVNQQLQEEIELREASEEELRSANQRLQALSAFVQSAREEEKSHSASRVHDELGQTLMVLQMALKKIERDHLRGEDATAVMRSVYDITGQLAELVKAISTELRPPILDDAGLEAAMEWQAREFQEKTGIACAVEHSTGEAYIALETSTALFRIFQEITNNLALRPGIAHVRVEIGLENGWLVMTVGCDGGGVSQEDLQRAAPLSFAYMREYAGKLGGDVGIISSREKGDVVEVRVPA